MTRFSSDGSTPSQHRQATLSKPEPTRRWARATDENQHSGDVDLLLS